MEIKIRCEAKAAKITAWSLWRFCCSKILYKSKDFDTVIALSDEKIPDVGMLQTEVIPTTAEVKENVARVICRAAKNGN